MLYDVIILAAGKGSRTNLEYNKIFYKDTLGISILERSVSAFSADEHCQHIIITTNIEEIEQVKLLMSNETKVSYAYGGETRQESVYNALACVQAEHVMIHDGARCFLSKRIIESCKEQMEQHSACVVMVPSIDTLKRIINEVVVETLVRCECYSAQTPQCFQTQLIKDCYKKGKEAGFVATDDTSLVEKFSEEKIYMVEGDYRNIKVTTPGDLK